MLSRGPPCPNEHCMPRPVPLTGRFPICRGPIFIFASSEEKTLAKEKWRNKKWAALPSLPAVVILSPEKRALLRQVSVESRQLPRRPKGTGRDRMEIRQVPGFQREWTCPSTHYSYWMEWSAWTLGSGGSGFGNEFSYIIGKMCPLCASVYKYLVMEHAHLGSWELNSLSNSVTIKRKFHELLG